VYYVCLYIVGQGCDFSTAGCDDYPYSCASPAVEGCTYDYQASVCYMKLCVIKLLVVLNCRLTASTELIMMTALFLFRTLMDTATHLEVELWLIFILLFVVNFILVN